MEATIEKGPFESTVLLREIRLNRKNFSEKLVVDPSQVPLAQELVLTAMRVENFSPLPKRLHNNSFTIIFDTNREMDLVLSNSGNISIHFDFSEGDDLMDLLDCSYQKWRDIGQMERGRTEDFPTSPGAVFSPPFDG